MAYYCHSCGDEQIFEVKVGIKVGRRDSCPHCGADLHVCKNCQHFDPNVHNQCREPEAAFMDLHGNMDLAEGLCKHLIKRVLERSADEIEALMAR